MKLLNQSVKYLSISILLIISVWALVFYINMLDEIKESIDEGLENYKRLIIRRVRPDSGIVPQKDFDETFFTIREISSDQAFQIRDTYIDTLMYMQDADDEEPELEPVRMLTTAFEKNGRFYELKIINSMVEEDDLIEELFRETVYLYLILIAAILVINNIVLQRLWKPFYNLLSQLKTYRLGSSKNLPEIKTRTREFNDLQHAVRTLLQHTTETYEQQKQFIGNASHELQTPLAIAMNKLELFLEKGHPEDPDMEDITQVLQIIERLVRLNKSLLLLTKIENRQFADDQSVSISEVTAQAIQELQDVADFKEVSISVEETSGLIVHMDVSLAGIVITNLIRNAVFHNVSGGNVNIHIADNAITICNTGLSAPLDADRIFNRFHKSDTGSGGTGLGLAIVKAICNIYRFKASYFFDNGKHCFKIDFTFH